MKKIFGLFSVVLLLTACKQKKIIVYSKGPAEVNTDAKTITSKDGTGHDEKEVLLGSSNVTYKIKGPMGEGTIDLPGDGLFIVNAKPDTIVGGINSFGDPTKQKVVSQAELKLRIDSMVALLEGKNASEANKSYYLLPNKSARISDNIKSMVIGPYHRMRSAEKVDGKDPEVYRFYTLKEFREKIEEMRALTVAQKQ
ncbi:hypothetical protein GWC95_00745 [Sediminibacterium roseum]|uniref:DUF4369 domain-containing protein n=1 Tax=Sediminibacterium roseum TaxID=1978412 RepID=A0ABW9ZTA1_9BACT|nr:hypothetical protein [Sediminibacterium roseum]NCI48428.1 hypothetical protein [Sediminibacterium roseum]